MATDEVRVGVQLATLLSAHKSNKSQSTMPSATTELEGVHPKAQPAASSLPNRIDNSGSQSAMPSAATQIEELPSVSDSRLMQTSASAFEGESELVGTSYLHKLSFEIRHM